MRDKSGFIKAIAKKILDPVIVQKRSTLTLSQLKARESAIGAKIFGPIKPNERREFFNDNEKSWFFHQEITASNGTVHSVTLHYEVHPTGVLRVSSMVGVPNEFIKGQELQNFIQATEIYHELVMNQIYKRTPSVDKKSK